VLYCEYNREPSPRTALKLDPSQFPDNYRTVSRALDKWLSTTVTLITKCIGGKYLYLKVALAATILSLLVSFPFYKGTRERLDTYITARALASKVLHPFAPVPADLKNPALYTSNAAGGASHADKLDPRLTVPVLGWLSGTGAWTVVIWNPIAGVVTFYLLAILAFAALGDEISAALFVLGLAPTFFGAWFFNDFDVGDGIGYCLMLASLCARPALSSLLIFAAAFCDERCVTAAPLLLLYVAVRFRDTNDRKERNYRYFALAAGILAWAMARWWIANRYGLGSGRTELMSWEILRFHLSSTIPNGLAGVFKVSWLIPVFAVASLLTQRKWLFGTYFILAIAIALGPAFIVWDYDRSAAYLIPALVLSLYFFCGDHQRVRKVLAFVVLANVLLSLPYRSALCLAGSMFPHHAK